MDFQVQLLVVTLELKKETKEEVSMPNAEEEWTLTKLNNTTERWKCKDHQEEEVEEEEVEGAEVDRMLLEITANNKINQEEDLVSIQSDTTTESIQTD